MNKLSAYITSGSGFGIKILLIASALIAIILAIIGRTAASPAIPGIQDTLNQLLPVTIENGTITAPADTIKTAVFRLHEDGKEAGLPVILDTTSRQTEPRNLKPGIYIQQQSIIVASSKKITTYSLKELAQSWDISGTWQPGDYSGQISSFLNWLIFIFAGAAFVGIFCVYFVLSLFYATVAALIAAAFKRKTAFDFRMRLSVICLLGGYLLSFLLGFAGIGLNGWAFFFTVIILQSLLIKTLPRTEA